MGPCQDKREGTEVGIHGGVGGAVFGDDDGIGEPDGETGGDDGVGCVGQVICIYPYVPPLSHGLSPDADIAKIMGNVEHFLADSDIRQKDAAYRLMQETEMKKLIQALRNNVLHEAKRITFLGYARTA